MTGPTVCVTGAASGIGAATCARLHAAGARVVGLDVRPAPTVDQYIAVDLGDPASVDRAIADMPARIDALCNVAGIAPCGDTATVLKVNFYGTRRLTLGLLPKMPSGSAITNVASLAGMRWRTDIARTVAALNLPDDVEAADLRAFCKLQDIDNVASYAVSKQMMIVWTKRMRGVLAPLGIRINSVSPGPVETPILGQFVAAFGDKATKDMAVTGKAGDAADIAEVVAFLSGDAARWVNGADIPVDGGLEAASLARELDF